MSYRDTATAIAQRAPGNFIGVVLYVPVGDKTAPWWSVSSFPSAAALQEWYEEIAPSPPLFYYLVAFDKTQGMEPAGEAIAPIKPGMPGFDMDVTGKWRAPPYKRARVAGIGAEPNDRGAAGVAKTVGIFALFAIPVGIILTSMQEKKQLREEKAAFQRLGLDWNKRVTY
jgi:hypothetical protein